MFKCLTKLPSENVIRKPSQNCQKRWSSPRNCQKKDRCLPYLVILCQHTRTAAKRCLAAALLPPPPQPPRCCHSAATIALCTAAIAADAAATAAPPPSCRQHPDVVLPPPPCCHQAPADVALSRCRHRRSCRAAATALPPLRCAPPLRCCRCRAAADLALSRCRAATTAADLAPLFVGWLLCCYPPSNFVIACCHAMRPSMLSRFRPLLPITICEV